MARGAKGGEKTPIDKKSRRSSHSRASFVDKAIETFQEKLSSDDVKATVGDFIRLLQLQKELETDRPHEIKVTWVEPAETESKSEK